MFTGIVRETGRVAQLKKLSGSWELGIKSSEVYRDAAVSDSISVNGVCLTVTGKKKDLLFFEAVRPTVEVTTLKRLHVGSAVNLEPALNAGDKIGGHYVLGHVDCESLVKRIGRTGRYCVVEVKYPAQYKDLLVDKGSVAVDGISLTVAAVHRGYFTVNVIPHTFDTTVLKEKRAGSRVNLEFDYLLKSVRKRGG